MKIKICGLTEMEDILAVNQAMPDYIGFVFAKKSRRYISPEKAAELKKKLLSEIKAVGVFVDVPVELPIKLMKDGVIDVAQFHGSESIAYVEAFIKASGGIAVKAISMTGEGYQEELRKWERCSVDFLLLDSGAGGTGQQFDYSRIGQRKKPFFLAGGLTPDNIETAINQVACYGVDLSSGVEIDGTKDAKKIEQAVGRIRNVKR